MNERIHRYLDGDLSLAELTEAEAREASAYEDVLRRTAAAASAEEVPDVTSAVMERIAHEAPPFETDASEAATTSFARKLDRMVAWFWAPRTIRLRPAYGFAVAAAALLAVMTVSPGSGPVPADVVSGDGDPISGQVFVQFRLDAPEASTVHLAGSFTDWQPQHTLHQSAPGVWSLLVPLEPGVHEYSFVIDGGEWTPDPAGPRVSDGFGGENSRVTVLLPNGRSL